MDLCNAPSGGAIRALSYPETLGFPKCRAFQVSPRAPAALLQPHQPCSAEPVLLFPISSFRHMLGPYNPVARLALALTPARSGSAHAASRFLVAQHPSEMHWKSERVECGIAAASARSDAMSPIRGIALRQKLDTRWRRASCRSWRTDVPLRACKFGSLAGCAKWSLRSDTTLRNPPSVRVRARSARDRFMSFTDI